MYYLVNTQEPTPEKHHRYYMHSLSEAMSAYYSLCKMVMRSSDSLEWYNVILYWATKDGTEVIQESWKKLKGERYEITQFIQE